jgi:hypothetical protein
VSEREAKMLYQVNAKPKQGITHAEVKASIELFEHWTPPAGLEYKSFNMAIGGRMFILVETDSPVALAESIVPWSGVYLDYEVLPVAPIKDAVENIKKGISAREKHL